MTISERGRKAEQIIGENPYDVDAWGVLLREAQVIILFMCFKQIFNIISNGCEKEN